MSKPGAQRGGGLAHQLLQHRGPEAGVGRHQHRDPGRACASQLRSSRGPGPWCPAAAAPGGRAQRQCRDAAAAAEKSMTSSAPSRARFEVRSSAATPVRATPASSPLSRPRRRAGGAGQRGVQLQLRKSRQQAQQAPAHAAAGADNDQPDRAAPAGHGALLKKRFTPSRKLFWRGAWRLPSSRSDSSNRCSNSRCSAESLTGVSTITRQNRSPARRRAPA